MLPRQIKQGEGVMGDAVLERKVSEGVCKGGDICEDTDEKIGEHSGERGRRVPRPAAGTCVVCSWTSEGSCRAGREGPQGREEGKEGERRAEPRPRRLFRATVKTLGFS